MNHHCEFCGSERVVWDTRSGLASVAHGTLNVLVSIVEFFGALLEGIFGGGSQTYRRNDSAAAAATKEWRCLDCKRSGVVQTR